MSPNTPTWVSGLLLSTAVGTAVYWHDRARRSQDAIMYMVEDDADEILKEWSGEE